MKFVVLIDPMKRDPNQPALAFVYDEPGPVPPISAPPDPDKPKDGRPTRRVSQTFKRAERHRPEEGEQLALDEKDG